MTKLLEMLDEIELAIYEIESAPIQFRRLQRTEPEFQPIFHYEEKTSPENLKKLIQEIRKELDKNNEKTQ